MLTCSIAILAGVVAGVVTFYMLWNATALSGARAERDPHLREHPDGDDA